MKVFISWSGKLSKEVALLFHEWIGSVIQNCDPFISDKDIQSGSWWFTEINDQLSSTNTGIICLTRANKDKPWILFEAGALTKGTSKSRAIPFLIDIDKVEIGPPLSQLNLVEPNVDDLYSLVTTINNQLDNDQRVKERNLKNSFDALWPQFIEKFNKILSENKVGPDVPERSDKEILNEILLTVRSFEDRIKDLERSTVKTILKTEVDPRYYKYIFTLTPANNIDNSKLTESIRALLPNAVIAFQTDSNEETIQIHIYMLKQLGESSLDVLKILMKTNNVVMTRESING